MPKRSGIDHIVLCVRDLKAARQRFGAFGFTTTPPARHPFGTGNSLVQMGASFIELLTVVEPERIPPHTNERFSFGAHNAAFLREREGMSMLVISSSDARADETGWRRVGLKTYEPVYFERQATLPDGSQAKVAFTIAFAADPGMPGLVFFCCQQHFPEAFWQRAYQQHANGALDFDSVTLVCPDPLVHADFLGALLQTDPLRCDGRIAFPTAIGRIEAIGSADAAARSLAPADAPRFAAAAVKVPDLDRVAKLMRSSGVVPVDSDGRLIVSADDCFGLALEFVQATG